MEVRKKILNYLGEKLIPVIKGISLLDRVREGQSSNDSAKLCVYCFTEGRMVPSTLHSSLRFSAAL